MRLGTLILLVACGSDKVAVQDKVTATDADADTDTDADTDVTSNTIPGPPCFEDDIVPIFRQSCGSGDNSCHAAIAYAADPTKGCRGWLSLEDRPLGSVNPLDSTATGCPDVDLYGRLTGLSSWECFTNGSAQNGNISVSVPYVTPGDETNSYLWWKIDPTGVVCDTPYPGIPSQRMPLDLAMSPTERSTIEEWISEGAVRCDASTTPTTTTTPTVVGQAPTVEIWHPGDGETRYISAGDFPFIGVASDPEDGDITADLSWSDDVQGGFGSGGTLDWLPTPAGTHTITASVVDSDGNPASAQIQLDMEP